MIIKWQLVEKYLIWLLLLVTPFLFHQFGHVKCCLEEECLALLNLQAYMNSFSIPTYSWSNPGEINCCNWSEVRCNVSSGRVTKLLLNSKVWRDDEDAMKNPWLFNVTLFRPFSQLIYLDLSLNDINGLVEDHGSTKISTLKNLRVLKLDSNNLGSGHISVSDLTSLRKLSLSHASLNESSFPLYQELSNLWKLRVLDLSSNYFSSDIQGTWLCRLRNLQELYLSDNIFKGGIPPCISNLTSLQTLSLSHNNFKGGIPPCISNLTSLQILVLAENDFSKELPDLSNLKSLQYLDLSDNNFEGKFFMHSLASLNESSFPLYQGSWLCRLRNLQELYLHENKFKGGIPPCISNLTSLQTLALAENDFSKELPDLSNLKSLQYLDISNNNFEGKFSMHSLANHSKLLNLGLSGNRLQVQTEDAPTFQLQYLGLSDCKLNEPLGTIPKFLSYQYNLTYIDLSDNNLVGPFPNWLLTNNSHLRFFNLYKNSLTGNLQLLNHTKPLYELTYMKISNNKFSGELPATIGFLLPNLGVLSLGGNAFEGQIPSSITRMENLQYLDMSHNKFSGELPSRLLSNLSSLEYLDLSDNSLQGDVIPDNMNLSSLIWLKLNNNNFGGKIKDALVKYSSSLRIFDISNNKVSGRLPYWIGNFSKLTVLSVSNNVLQGHIPTELSKLGLQYLDLSENNFNGKMIPSFYNQSLLQYLHLGKNNLRGSLPDVLSNFSQLITLDLADNHLTGSIPWWLSKFQNLRVLQLGGNQLQGELPLQLCELANINILDISHNNLSGKVPPCFKNLSFGKRSITSDDDDIPEKVTVLVKNDYLTYTGDNKLIMSALDLSCNKLTGLIPPELGELEHIHSFNLSHNNLSGPIPDSFSNLKNIESLDLSFNNLSGNIPSQLVELNTLEIFNVSYNNLSGRVPVSGQFGDFDESNYRGNPGLFGFPGSELHNQTQALPPSSLTKDGDHDETFVQNFLWSFGMTYATIFLATIAVLHINPRWRQACFDFIDWHILWWLPMSVRSLY